MADTNATPCAVVPKRTRRPTLELTCLNCKKEFLGNSYRQNTCGADCRFAFYQQAGDSDQCWEWQGPSGIQGYGVLFLDQNRANGRRLCTSAHRYSYIKTHGLIPDEKPCILHLCDNPSCTNPAHLVAGTRDDNNKDRAAKGRNGTRKISSEERLVLSLRCRGEGSHTAKLNSEQVLEIRSLAGMSSSQIALRYGVTKSCIKTVLSRRSWKHI